MSCGCGNQASLPVNGADEVTDDMMSTTDCVGCETSTICVRCFTFWLIVGFLAFLILVTRQDKE